MRKWLALGDVFYLSQICSYNLKEKYNNPPLSSLVRITRFYPDNPNSNPSINNILLLFLEKKNLMS